MTIQDVNTEMIGRGSVINMWLTDISGMELDAAARARR